MLNARSNLLETNDILQRGDPEDVDMFYGVDAAGVLDDVAERNEMVPVADMHLTAQQNEQVDNIVDKSSRSEMELNLNRSTYRLVRELLTNIFA